MNSKGFWLFLGRRVASMLVILAVIAFALFFFMSLAPGDYFTAFQDNPDVDKTMLAQKRAEFGLDQPFYTQFFLWVKNVVTKGDFGMSFTYRQPVFDLIATRLPNTIVLGLLSLVATYAMAYPLSLYFAYKPRRWLDRSVDLSTLLLYSAPPFFLALLALLLAAWSGLFPINGATSPGSETLGWWGQLTDRLHHLVLPLLVGFLGGLAGSIRSMKVLLHEEFAKPYISAARARGLPGKRIILHALRNALIPFITDASGIFAVLISGSLFVEQVFGYPGLGKLMYDAAQAQDKYLVLVNMIVSGFLVLLGNLVSDILLAIADPRVRMK